MNYINTNHQKIYTGSMTIKKIDCYFMFDGSILEITILNRKNIKNLDDFIKLENDILTGKCNESGEELKFLVENPYIIDSFTYVIKYDVQFYIICSHHENYLSKMTFKSVELDCIYPANQAIEYLVEKDKLFNQGIFQIKNNGFNEHKLIKNDFYIEDKKISVSFCVVPKLNMSPLKPPITLQSCMEFTFENVDDYIFIYKLFILAKKFIQFLCYRRNVSFSDVILSTFEENKYIQFANAYLIDNECDENLKILKDRRYIRQSYIDGIEGKILSDIYNGNLYMRHFPKSHKSGAVMRPENFVMITAAFEWEFKRLFPEGIAKEKASLDLDNQVKNNIKKLFDSSSGKLKKRYGRILKSLDYDSTLQSKVIHAGKELDSIIHCFGVYLYKLNDTCLDYKEMGKRIADQRNHYAHGDLNEKFIGTSLLDLIYLERIIYVMQLKVYGLNDSSIKHAINDLFGFNIRFED